VYCVSPIVGGILAGWLSKMHGVLRDEDGLATTEDEKRQVFNSDEN
jgi:hypothetical protein